MSRNRMRWTVVVGAVLGILVAGALLYMREPEDSSSHLQDKAKRVPPGTTLRRNGGEQATERALHQLMDSAQLAAVYFDQVKYEQAQTVLERSVAILEEAREPDVRRGWLLTGFLARLGEVHIAKREYAEAESVLQRAMEVLDGRPGPSQPYVLGYVLALLGEVHRDQGEHAEAESAYGRSLAILEQAAHADPWPLAAALSGLARARAHQGKCEEAETLYRRAVAIWEKVSERRLVEDLQDLAALLRHTGRESEAEALEARARAVRSSGSKDEEE